MNVSSIQCQSKAKLKRQDICFRSKSFFSAFLHRLSRAVLQGQRKNVKFLLLPLDFRPQSTAFVEFCVTKIEKHFPFATKTVNTREKSIENLMFFFSRVSIVLCLCCFALEFFSNEIRRLSTPFAGGLGGTWIFILIFRRVDSI